MSLSRSFDWLFSFMLGVLIALIRLYIFGTTIFGVFSQTQAFSAIQIIIFRVYFYFILFYYLSLLRLASRFQVAIGINSRGCVGKMLLFAYYLSTWTNYLILWISDSFIFVCITTVLAITSCHSIRRFLLFSDVAWFMPSKAWPTVISDQIEFNDRLCFCP